MIIFTRKVYCDEFTFELPPYSLDLLVISLSRQLICSIIAPLLKALNRRVL